jgi:hypothetical protein
MSSNDDDVNASAKSDRARRDRIRARHDQAAKDGRHLPSLNELLAGGSFMGGDIFTDCKTFAERTMHRVDQSSKPGADVYTALTALTCHPRMDDFEHAADLCRHASHPKNHTGDVKAAVYRGPDLPALTIRLDLYAAAMGSRHGCVRVAKHAIRLAREVAPLDVCNKYFEAAVGWLAIADEAHEVVVRRGKFSRWDDMRGQAEGAARVLLDEFTRYQAVVSSEVVADVMDRKDESKAISRKLRDDIRALDCDRDLAEILERPEAAQALGVVVIREVGMVETSEGKGVAKIFKDIIGARVPFATAPASLTGVRAVLAAEFPHAADAVNAILSDLRDGEPIRLRPTILVGEPGCGKTTMARRMMALLGLAAELYPCGGMGDSSIAGTARRWSSGEPSLPLALIRRHKICNPAIVLDEVEKAGTSRHNGNILDALIGMLEPTSSSVWHDVFVQAGVNISACQWIGTANTTDGIPVVLRDRCRIVRVPNATADHLPTLAAALLKSAVRERGLSDSWALPLDGEELAALAACWSGGSIRKLGRLVEGVLSARDQISARQ